MQDLPTNLPDLEQPCPIFILTKAATINKGPTIDVSKFVFGFVLQIKISFLNVEIIRGFTSTFLPICSTTSHLLVFTSRRKYPPLDILTVLITELNNDDTKFAFLLVDKYGALTNCFEVVRTYHIMNIIVQATDGNASSLNGKNEIPNRIVSKITTDLILNSSHKKYLWCFAYQYSICISHLTYNRLRGDVPYFLQYRSRHLYKHIKIWGVRLYIINRRATIKTIDCRSHRGYFMGYEATTVVILYWNPDQTFVIYISHHTWFDEFNSCIST